MFAPCATNLLKPRGLPIKRAPNSGWIQCAPTLPEDFQQASSELVELARAAISNPKMLCLDEPSSGLSVEEAAQLSAVFRRLNAQGTTILLVSHDMELMTISSTINVLSFGEIIATGGMSEVKSNRRVREAYLGV